MTSDEFIPSTGQSRTDEGDDSNKDYIKSALDAAEGVAYEDESNIDGEIVSPFDPTEIRMEQRVSTIDLLIKRMENEEINMQPDFQRHGGIWSNRAQSQLIESLLIRIPLPAFYMDATDDEKWLVIDGLQRLTTLKRFVIDKSLKLRNLEFLVEFEGKTFDNLPRSLQRRIEEAQITLYLVKEGTPPKVKFNIFKRINTGGVPLSGQEIRHALNLGPATKLLADLADSKWFKEATSDSVNPKRMADREMVLRFLAFWIRPFTTYDSSDDLDGFLTETMTRINAMNPVEIDRLRDAFRIGVTTAHAIFGESAFRKQTRDANRRSAVSKALFEVWTVNLARLTRDERDQIINLKEDVREGFFNLLDNDEFTRYISYTTGSAKSVHHRFSAIEQLIKDILRAQQATPH